MSEETITLKDGRVVLKSDYITAKTKDLQEYGYATLTEEEVKTQLNKILYGDINLSVIGLFMEDDIKLCGIK